MANTYTQAIEIRLKVEQLNRELRQIEERLKKIQQVNVKITSVQAAATEAQKLQNNVQKGVSAVKKLEQGFRSVLTSALLLTGLFDKQLGLLEKELKVMDNINTYFKNYAAGLDANVRSLNSIDRALRGVDNAWGKITYNVEVYERLAKRQVELEKTRAVILRRQADALRRQRAEQEAIYNKARKNVRISQESRGGSGFAEFSQAAGGAVRRRIEADKRAERAAIEDIERLRETKALKSYNTAQRRKKFLAKLDRQRVDEYFKAERQRIRTIENEEKAAARRAAKFRENILLGVGFPLLFGGGPGAVAGGALGSLVGDGFGGQIIFSAIGQQIDAAIANIATLGQALNPLTRDIDAVTKAAGLSGTALAAYIQELENSTGAAEAAAEAERALAAIIGIDGVDALEEFGVATQRLSNAFDRAMSVMAAGIARIINSLPGFLRFTQNVEESGLLSRALASQAPEQLENVRALEKSRVGTGGVDIAKQQAAIKELVRTQRLIEQGGGDKQQLEIIAKRIQLADQEIAAAQLGNDLTNDAVYKAQQELLTKKHAVEIQEVLNKKLTDSARNAEFELLHKKQTAEVTRLEFNRRKALVQLSDKTNAAGEREQTRIQKALITQQALTTKAKEQTQFSEKIFAAEMAKDAILVRSLQGQQKLAELKAQTTKQLQLEKSEVVRLAIQQTALAKETQIRKETEQDIAKLQREQVEKFEDALAALTYQVEYEAAVTREKREQLELEEAIRKAKGQGFTPEQVDKVAEQTKRRQAQQRPLQKYMTDLEKSLNDTEGKVVQLAQTIENELSTAMSSAITGIITGTTTVEEAFSQMFLNIGKAFIDMATQMLAQQLILSILKGVIGGGSNMGGSGYYDPMTGLGTAGPNFGLADGGPVNPNGIHLVGEQGPELFVPGRAGTVVPNDIFAATRAALNKGGTSGAGAFEENAQALAVSTSYTRERVMEKDRQTMLTGAGGSMLIQTEVINNVEYATVDQVAQIAATSAKQARAQVFADMRNKPSTRASLGMR